MSSDEAVEAFHAALLDDDPAALYERAPCGYLSTTPDGTIIKVNQTFLSLTGYDRDQVVGCRTFADLLSPGGQMFHETHYAPMLRLQGNAREIALDIVRADGTRHPVLVNSVLERDPDGVPIVVRTAVFDATARREYERELMRAKERAEASEAQATALARTLQRTLMPPAPPDIPGLDVGAAYQAAGAGTDVGGDFYDIFEIGAGDWVIAVGDVCGKGVEAAAVTALARHTIRAAAVNQSSPAAILTTLNAVLLKSETDRFCTVALLRMRRRSSGWEATVSRGGHPPPLRCPPGVEPSPMGPPGSLLGILTPPKLTDTEMPLRSGDRVLIYTDGVTEGRRGEDLFGDERLGAVAGRPSASAADLAETVLAEVLAFQDGDARDDIAIVALVVP